MNRNIKGYASKQKTEALHSLHLSPRAKEPLEIYKNKLFTYSLLSNPSPHIAWDGACDEYGVLTLPKDDYLPFETPACRDIPELQIRSAENACKRAEI